jgi:hypothetical protein
VAEERIEPTLDLTIEGKHYNERTEQFTGTGDQGTVHLDPESERELVEKLRAVLAQRLEYLTGVLALRVNELDFISPALPSRSDLEGIGALLERLTDTAAALREMSPEVWRDEDDDDPELDPAPDPEGAAHA